MPDRGAHFARSSRDAKDITLTKQLVGERDKRNGHCMFCGSPVKNGNVCVGHSDLVKAAR